MQSLTEAVHGRTIHGYRMSKHAIDELEDRCINPLDLVELLERPDTIFEDRKDKDLRIFWNDACGAVVNIVQKIVLTLMVNGSSKELDRKDKALRMENDANLREMKLLGRSGYRTETPMPTPVAPRRVKASPARREAPAAGPVTVTRIKPFVEGWDAEAYLRGLREKYAHIYDRVAS